ncbi:hypothetical protein QJS66_18455 [Kocuria rhizophila]|nr:hypothetical protein QJS66_18455 [Kocuria rhizophila]
MGATRACCGHAGARPRRPSTARSGLPPDARVRRGVPGFVERVAAATDSPRATAPRRRLRSPPTPQTPGPSHLASHRYRPRAWTWRRSPRARPAPWNPRSPPGWGAYALLRPSGGPADAGRRHGRGPERTARRDARGRLRMAAGHPAHPPVAVGGRHPARAPRRVEGARWTTASGIPADAVVVASGSRPTRWWQPARGPELRLRPVFGDILRRCASPLALGPGEEHL